MLLRTLALENIKFVPFKSVRYHMYFKYLLESLNFVWDQPIFCLNAGEKL